MGLDMFLTEEAFICEHFVSAPARPKYSDIKGTVSQIQDELGLHGKIKTVSAEVGYWRKANAIHQWFVDRVQGGNDDCKRYEVSPTDLEDLHQACVEVLADRDRAEELLPTRSGFFFGGLEYDDWYFDDIQETINIISGLRSEDGSITGTYYYQSSW